jgi:hypothetical protein
MLALAVATIAGFVISAAYYALLSESVPDDADRTTPDPSPAILAVVELTRSAAVAGLVTGLVSIADWTTPSEGALLGLGLWTLPVVLLAGSVVHEGTRHRDAFRHAGDWLIKLVVMGLIIGALS